MIFVRTQFYDIIEKGYCLKPVVSVVPVEGPAGHNQSVLSLHLIYLLRSTEVL